MPQQTGYDFLQDGLTGRSYTAIISELLRAGVEPGCVVAALLPNIPEYPILFMAAVEAGLVVTPINPSSKRNFLNGNFTLTS